LFEQTVFDEAAFSLKHRAAKKTAKEIREKVDEALDTVGLLDKKNSFPQALQRSDRFKTVLASILAMGPKIILLDEPTAGQDSPNCRMIMDLTKSLHEKGYTIVLITHNTAIAAEYAKRIIVMKKANIYMDGSPQAIFAQTDKLLKAGILPPQIIRLSQALQKEIALKKEAQTPCELAAMLIEGRKA
jgi:energy-coupling factor transport system ATP-binding protein